MKEYIVNWFHKLAAAIITGAATSALSVLGIAAADVAGANVKALDYSQAGAMFISGGIVGLLAYLKQSPLPRKGTNDE